MWPSVPQSPTRFTRIRTSRGPGRGGGTSFRVRPLPGRSLTRARIASLPGRWMGKRCEFTSAPGKGSSDVVPSRIMYTVTETVHFCYGHRLLEYCGKCIHPHGHNAKVEIELAADRLDRLGVVGDFSQIGDAIKGWIDDPPAHRMLL